MEDLVKQQTKKIKNLEKMLATAISAGQVVVEKESKAKYERVHGDMEGYDAHEYTDLDYEQKFLGIANLIISTLEDVDFDWADGHVQPAAKLSVKEARKKHNAEYQKQKRAYLKESKEKIGKLTSKIA